MDLLKRFVSYLTSQKNNYSKATIKNYRADAGQFIRWFEKTFNKLFNTKDITPELIEVYKKSRAQDISQPSRPLSSRSLKRHLSSLRKFFHFLKIEGAISKDPLETISNSLKNASSQKDKLHLNQFKNYLYIYNLANLTIKNYIIDVKQFFVWLEKVTGVNNSWDVREKNVFEKISPILINEYKERLLSQNFSPKTINRKLSSLRKYISFASEKNLIKTDSLYLQIKNENLHPYSSSEVRGLTDESRSTVIGISRSSGNDNDNSRQPRTRYSRIPPFRLLQKTTNGIIFILDSLLVLPLARTIEQVKYVFWKIKGKPIFKEVPNKQSREQNPSHRIGNWKLEIGNYSKAMYAPLSLSTRYFPLHKKLWHHVRHSRPKWYKKYHSYSIVHYFHFAILVIFMSAIGFSAYNDFINRAQNKDVLSALDSNMPRILAFRGRLTDSLDNPIVSPNTPLRIAIYNDQAATQSALLWQEVVPVNPNKDGVFEAILGNNVLVPQNIFFQNPSLWLGISIGQTAELTPRQELATVSYAVNTQTLQGLPPITNQNAGSQNVILALDSSGNLNIGGSATPVFQATGGKFTLSGKVLLLTTVFGSSSDVIISPDGLGKINLDKPIQNTSDNNNIPGAIGAVEVDDLFAVLATSSAQSAVTINQDGTGPIISASTSGAAKFTVENTGNIISAKGANWQPFFDSSNGLNIASSSGIPFVTFDTLHQSVGIGTVIPETSLDIIGSFRASGDIKLSKFTSNGGILYATQSGALSQITAGTSTQCLMGGSTPRFASCPEQKDIQSLFNESTVNIGIGTSLPQSEFHVTRPLSFGANGKALVIFDQIENQDIFTASASGATRFRLTNSGNVAINTTITSHPITVGTDGTNGNGAYLTAGGIWTNASSREMKTNFITLDPQAILDKINQLPVLKWNYKLEDPTIKHIGPIAEDFYSLFDVGNDNKHISSLDPAGVAILGIQGLSTQQASLSAIVKDINLTTIGDLDIAISKKTNPQASQTNNVYKLFKTALDGGRSSIDRIGAFGQIAVANLRVGFIKAEEIVSQTLNSSQIISPIAKIDEIRTNIISPLASDSLRIHLSSENSKLIVENASGSAVAIIDSSGNASFSGTLAANNLEVNNDATVAGTLRAKKILADSIEGLEAKVSTIAADYVRLNVSNGNSPFDTSPINISSYSAQLVASNLNASFATITQGLMSFGPTSLAETSIAGPLYIQGTLILAANSMNVLGNDLEIQPLRQGGISFLSGLIQIDKDGNIKSLGNAEFAKDVAIKGDLVASGSATFNKINLSLVQPALAVSQTEIIATGSAGVAAIKANQTELTIKNNLITDKSLIYVAPVGTPSAQAPFLMRQTPGESFSVGIQTPKSEDLLFNWLILN